jgi:hypothetical protein
MQGEQGGDKCAWPDASGHTVKNDKKQQCVSNVKGDIDEVVRTGALPEKRAIQHMRQPGQRMPVGGAARGEGPFDVLPGEA